jgi:hypothetical protein
MRLNRRKFLGILGATPILGAIVATVKTEPLPPSLPTLAGGPFEEPFGEVVGEAVRVANGSWFVMVGDNGERLHSLDGVTWTERC